MGRICNWSNGIYLNFKWNFSWIFFIKNGGETLCYNGWIYSYNYTNIFAWIFGICWQLKLILNVEFFSIDFRRIWGWSKFYSKYGDIKLIWSTWKRVIYWVNRGCNWSWIIIWSTFRCFSIFNWGIYFSICKFRYV